MQKWVMVPWEKYQEHCTDTEKKQTGSGENPLTIANILALLPKRFRTNAASILQHIDRDPDIDWNAKGEILINCFPIANSHLMDLLKDSSHNFKHWDPVGVTEFYKALAKSNLPLGLVQNKARRELLESYKQLKPPGIPNRKWLSWN